MCVRGRGDPGSDARMPRLLCCGVVSNQFTRSAAMLLPTEDEDHQHQFSATVGGLGLHLFLFVIESYVAEQLSATVEGSFRLRSIDPSSISLKLHIRTTSILSPDVYYPPGIVDSTNPHGKGPRGHA